MARKVQNISQPPLPPPFPRQVQLRPMQWIAIPLLMLIPLLALFGLFGKTLETLQAGNETVTVQLTYPTRLRYQMYDSMEVTVHNLSPKLLSGVEVRFPRDYIDQFGSVDFTPQAEAIEDEFYLVEFYDLAPQQTQTVKVSLQADSAWRHSGEIIIAAAGAEPVVLNVVTWVFP